MRYVKRPTNRAGFCRDKLDKRSYRAFITGILNFQLIREIFTLGLGARFYHLIHSSLTLKQLIISHKTILPDFRSLRIVNSTTKSI